MANGHVEVGGRESSNETEEGVFCILTFCFNIIDGNSVDNMENEPIYVVMPKFQIPTDLPW